MKVLQKMTKTKDEQLDHMRQELAKLKEDLIESQTALSRVQSPSHQAKYNSSGSLKDWEEKKVEIKISSFDEP